jgi:hypothetical protein
VYQQIINGTPVLLSDGHMKWSLVCHVVFVHFGSYRIRKKEKQREEEEGRGKREEGRGKREEGRGKREEGRGKTINGHTILD